MRQIDLLASGFVVAGVIGVWMLSGFNCEARLVGAQSLGDDVAAAEVVVARDRNDAEALRHLATSYLDRKSPGFALAAIQRAPEQVRQLPSVLHLWARALMYEGNASQALYKERQLAATCRQSQCGAALLASAIWHEQFLAGLVASGVEDFRSSPEATKSAVDSMHLVTVAALDRQSLDSSLRR